MNAINVYINFKSHVLVACNKYLHLSFLTKTTINNSMIRVHHINSIDKIDKQYVLCTIINQLSNKNKNKQRKLISGTFKKTDIIHDFL